MPQINICKQIKVMEFNELTPKRSASGSEGLGFESQRDYYIENQFIRHEKLEHFGIFRVYFFAKIGTCCGIFAAN